MICHSCGFLNHQQRLTCLKCGKSLSAQQDATGAGSAKPAYATQRPSVQPVRPQPIDEKVGATTDEIINKMKLDYSFSHGDPTQKVVDGLLAIVSDSLKSKCDMGKLTMEAANLIHRLFGVREVAIGLKSTSDGLYRYKVMVGIRGDAEQAMRRCVFKKSDFEDSDRYKGSPISKYTKIYLAENKPFTEEERATYSRPILLDSPRKSWMESLEGDYLNINIYGRDMEFIGFIELSGLRSGLLPDANTIRWVELIGQVIGAGLTTQGRKLSLPEISLPGVDR